MAVDNEYLEHHLGSLMTTAGTDLGDVTAVAPEVVKRARRRIDVDEQAIARTFPAPSRFWNPVPRHIECWRRSCWFACCLSREMPSE